MILSFNKTRKLAKLKGVEDPLFVGIKIVTRRIWSPRSAKAWAKAYNEGKKIHQAWSDCPRVKGAAQIGNIELTTPPYEEALKDMPQGDLYFEGNLWESREDFYHTIGASSETIVWVVWFNFTPIEKLP
ncbi:MAG TPA: hypothetical protein VK184_18930 [Nostocaceae cyanobacterium]|nr:hypothetical protein [Nostocaceae cyanobacterium]